MSDLEDWLEFAKALTYADDTSTSVSASTIEKVIRRLEIDAINVLKLMSSNGLVANAKKTWKANNLSNYPTKIKKQEIVENRATTRATTSDNLIKNGKTNIA